jgi:hypothetical protein
MFGSLLVGSLIAQVTHNGFAGLCVIVGAFVGLLAYQLVRAFR